DPRVLVVEELGLQHGMCRVDIAVVNGFLHGYEIKSDADTLVRLPQQVAAYSKALDRATLVVGERHVAAARTILPNWWGLKVITSGKRGALKIETERPVTNNPAVSGFYAAHLLWKDEILCVLNEYGITTGTSKLNRIQLYQL